MKKLGKWLFGYLMLALAIGGGWAFVGSLVKEWRAGTAFARYKNWRGQPISHADALIFFVVLVVVMLLGAAWTAWDKRREQRWLDKIRRRG